MHTLMSEQEKEAEHYLFYSTSFVSVIIIESWNLVQYLRKIGQRIYYND